jgi:predicted RNase H-like HicB family nuclease
MKNGNAPKYAVTIYWDNDDNIFVAEVPDLPGCMAHGNSQVEAVQNIGDAIDLWVETAREFGDKIPEPRRHQLAA